MTLRQPKYTDKFRASAVVMLLAAGWPEQKGAQSRVSKHLGVPRNTLVRWAKRANNPPPSELVQEKVKSHIEMLEELRVLLLQDMIANYEEAPFNHQATAYGILTDKQRLLMGESTDNNAVDMKIRYADD